MAGFASVASRSSSTVKGSLAPAFVEQSALEVGVHSTPALPLSRAVLWRADALEEEEARRLVWLLVVGSRTEATDPIPRATTTAACLRGVAALLALASGHQVQLSVARGAGKGGKEGVWTTHERSRGCLQLSESCQKQPA